MLLYEYLSSGISLASLTIVVFISSQSLSNSAFSVADCAAGLTTADADERASNGERDEKTLHDEPPARTADIMTEVSRVIPLTAGEPRAPKPEWLKVRAPGSPSYLRLKASCAS